MENYKAQGLEESIFWGLTWVRDLPPLPHAHLSGSWHSTYLPDEIPREKVMRTQETKA